MPTGYTLNRKQLLVELAAADPILKREADAVLRQQFFDPAVAKMKRDFEESPVTREIQAGITAENSQYTNSIQGEFNDPPHTKDGRIRDDYSPPNLFSFIGFDDGSNPTIEIEQRLDSRHPDGPKMKYIRKDADNLTFIYEVSAPDWGAIEKATPLPWTEGGSISWARRLEQGLSGVGHYLNAIRKGQRGAGSASHGGVQVKAQLRQGSFTPVKYLSSIFNAFLRKASSGRD